MPNLITPTGRVNYAFIHHPDKKEDGSPVYRLTLWWEDDSELGELKRELVASARDRWPGVDVKAVTFPLKRASEVNGLPDEGWACAFKRDRGEPRVVRPVIGKDGRRTFEACTETDVIYSGCWASVSYRPYAWEYKREKGVSLSLVDVCKIRDDDPVAGSFGNPDEDFASLPTDFDDDPLAQAAEAVGGDEDVF